MSAFLKGSEKYYSAAVAKQREVRGMTEAERLIARADEVSIFDVLQDFFGLSLPREGNSFKSRCPFAYEHADGGLDKGWRTYPATNSSHCFPMHGYMTTTRLIQIKYGERAVRAAERILRNYDLLKPKPWRERYAELVESQESGSSKIGNPQHAVSALHVALRNNSEYTARQFDPDVLQAMEVVLEALNHAVAQDTPEALQEWYQKAKKAMLMTIRRNTK